MRISYLEGLMGMNRATSFKNAFSLVELSIVLVILGLLVGGVLSGQSLIRAAELRSVSSEYQRYTTAMGSFRDKYFALPGDMNNAVAFWGNADTGNGDGDGTIESTATAIGAAGALTSNEISNFWIHLAKASLVEGTYTAIANTTLTAPANNPKAKLSNAVWNAGTLGSIANTSTVYFEGSYGNVLYFGSGTAAATPSAVLKPEEAWNLDTKQDDGLPHIGSITSLESQGLTAGTACSSITASAATLAASAYSLANTSSACSLVLKTGY